VSEKLSEDQAAVLGAAALRMVIAFCVALTLSILAAFVVDSNLLRGLAGFFWIVGGAHAFFIKRRQAQLALGKGQELRHGRRTLLWVWAGAAVSAALIFAVPDGPWTLVPGIALFLLIVMAGRMTSRSPRAHR
jgi:hypothetical protein